MESEGEGSMWRIVWTVVVAIMASPAGASEEWSYGGERGPEHWQELEEGSACAGERQSPINIIRTDSDPDTQAEWPLSLHYPPTTRIHEVTNNGHSIQFGFDKGDELEFLDARYGLVQIHFHEPSEHTLNGVRYPIEMHLVHYNEALARFTVLAVFGYEGAASEGYDFLESYLPLAHGETKAIGEAFDLRRVLPHTLVPRYHYQGSLTTPPCTENVNWVVFEEPFMLAEEQVLRLKHNMPVNNYRDTQPLHDREVSLIVH